MKSALLALAVLGAETLSGPARAGDLPNPLRLADVPALARSGRGEVAAAVQRAIAAEQRPAIVGALEDPMISPSVDHWPLGERMADVSVTIEQRFPLSGILGDRRRSAEAEGRRFRAEVDRLVLDVEVDALTAFLMLHERREQWRILGAQRALAEQIVAATVARYQAGGGPQADVIQAEIELARLKASLRVAAAQVHAAEAMFNASVGREVPLAVPTLEVAIPDTEPITASAAVSVALSRRPELKAGAAEVGRAEAETSVMRSMYAPMALVRTGPAYTMAEGRGAMLMVGVSIPLWRDKLRAGVAEAEAMQRMSAADLSAMRRMAEGEAARTREEVEAARIRFIALRDDVLPRARQGVEPTLAAYATGQVPLVSVLQAVRVLWSTESELVTAEVELGVARVRFGRSIGDLEGTLQ